MAIRGEGRSKRNTSASWHNAALWRHVKDDHVKDVAQDAAQDVVEDVLGAAKGGSGNVFIVARAIFQRRNPTQDAAQDVARDVAKGLAFGGARSSPRRHHHRRRCLCAAGAMLRRVCNGNFIGSLVRLAQMDKQVARGQDTPAASK